MKGGTKGGTKQPGKGGTKHAEAVGTKGGTRIALTKKQRELYDLLHDNNSLSIDEVAIIFKVNASAVQKHFEALKEKGVILRMCPSSGGFWEVLINL